jgi:valyl-tRNA synthetase
MKFAPTRCGRYRIEAEEIYMPQELPKAYDPTAIEDRWAEFWVRERLFDVATPSEKDGAELNTFTMLLPPPNVTGRLHMGHMLNQTEMDILTRWHRMRGETALWLPGTDHAGIATQMMVERQLTAEGKTRQAMGREAFVERVWEWKRHYGGAIQEQMKRLGASVDWSREYFTMDARLSAAVKEAFVRLHEQGLIYRGAYIVNWCPRCQTAISDLEVVHEEQVGKIYEIRYPLVEGGGSITIATTRPETMLGDVAVAVNPNDERYKKLIGKMVRLPLSAAAGKPVREIPIIADDWANPEFGTGAVKVTPAHDANDFAIGQRHGLEQINIMDETAHIALPGSAYDGLDRFVAREKILADLDTLGLFVAAKEHTNSIGRCDRCKTIVEPRLSKQWFIAVNKKPASGDMSMAEAAIVAVDMGYINFTPEQYRKTYDEWMKNIHDWCISRQLWWGHRIPAWHCAECGEITVARETPAKCSQCGSAKITQETDVLDTWFSSGLLPFTVFGWPAEDGKPNADMAAFYPTSLLVTGFDILFFWVARMIMLGCHFMLDVPMADGSKRELKDAVPFREVYIHALVRDADRQKMSKTKGNVIDPIEIIGRFGTDAVRFTLASMASPGTDIAFSEARTEGYRAFANKIWNAARFIFMNIERAKEAWIELDLAAIKSRVVAKNYTDQAFTRLYTKQAMPNVADDSPLEVRWIVFQLHNTADQVDKALRDYRFDDAARNIYVFFWRDFCDWYLEFVKLRLNYDSEVELSRQALTTLVEVFEASLRLLSPFMPFITEEIWHAFFENGAPAKSIALAWYPEANNVTLGQLGGLGTYTIMTVLQNLITAVRSKRKEIGVAEKEFVDIQIYQTSDFWNQKRLLDDDDLVAIFKHFTKVNEITRLNTPPSINIDSLHAGISDTFDFAIPYEKQIDIPAERERLTKDLAKYEKGLAAAEKQLGNAAFIAKAPENVVAGLKKQQAETQMMFDKTKAALDALGK